MKKILTLTIVLVMMLLTACSSDLFYATNIKAKEVTKEEYSNFSSTNIVNIVEEYGIIGKIVDENGNIKEPEQSNTFDNKSYFILSFNLKGNGEENADYIITLQIGIYVNGEIVEKYSKILSVHGNVNETYYVLKTADKGSKINCKILKLDWN